MTSIPSSSAGLALTAGGGVPPSAAGRRFQQQLARIDKLKAQLAELDALAALFGPRYHEALEPLRERHRRMTREMALWLDQRLAGKVLSALQRQTAVSILCGLAEALAARGDAGMSALHDRHSPRSLAQKTRDGADEVRAMMERLRQAVSDEQARRAEAAARRRARKRPSAAQAAAQAEQADAESSLRRLFRQLASALHPDRETDPQARVHKTALMSEVNAAYERRDLVALMQIQIRAELADAGAVARMTDDRLAALTRLLKEQVADLERERLARQQALMQAFELDVHAQVNPRGLEQHLRVLVHGLEDDLARMAADLERVRDDAAFKRWLTEQRRLSEADAARGGAFF